MTTPHAPRGLGDIIVTARPMDEYRAMFDLSDHDILAGPILDCPGGAGGFAAGVRVMGGVVTSVDPVYAMGRDALISRADTDTRNGNAYVLEHPDLYIWGFFRDADDHLSRRLGGLDAFAGDFHGPGTRHVVSALPDLPFRDRAFRLVLSAHLLFTYPDHLDMQAHRAALAELVRLARDEVRVFPFVDTTAERYPGLDDLRRWLADEGAESEVRRVPYEFQRGADEMLVIRPPTP